MIWNMYPYTDFHNMNQDWIIRILKEMEKKLDDFVATNSIKYANPFQWNITSQYEKNTLTIDAQSGTAYLSVQAVPSGVAITNTSYWTPVFDLGQLFIDFNKNFTGNDEQLNIVASTNYAVGDWLIWKNFLYEVIAPITAGDLLNEGVNIDRLTVENSVKVINSNIDAIETMISNNKIINVLDYPDVKSALTACPSGYTLYFPTGSYTWTDELIIDKAINIIFNDCVITHNTTPAQMLRLSHDDITIKGKAVFNGALGANNYFILGYPGYKNIIIDLDCDINDYIDTPLITLVKTDNVTIKGSLRCHDARAVLGNGCSHVNVSGVSSDFTTTCNLGVVVFTDSDDTHTYDDVTIHDCNLDGNDHATDGLLVVTRANANASVTSGYLPITNVKIMNNIVKNGTGATDGIDAVLVDNCIIKGNVISGCLEGIAALGNVFEIVDNIISNCDSAGIVIGDYNIGTGLTHSAITIGHNIITNCGKSQSGDPWIIPAAIGAKQQNGNKIATIYVDDCQLIDCPYGFYLDANVGGSNIALSDNFILANTAPVSIVDLSQMYMYDNKGLNPTGMLTIGNPGTSLTNNFGCKIELTFRANAGPNETNVSIDGVVVTIVPVGALAVFTLLPNQTITLTETPLIWSARGI